MAAGAAYASYQHGKDFALHHGSDPMLASIWPLVVDGLLTSAMVALRKTSRGERDGGRWNSWVAFIFGIAVRQHHRRPADELLRHRRRRLPTTGATAGRRTQGLKRRHAETTTETGSETGETANETEPIPRLRVVSDQRKPRTEPTAEERMWAFYVTERSKGRTPTGAELDRIAATKNYGRRILQRWKHTGRIGADGTIEPWRAARGTTGCGRRAWNDGPCLPSS
ncbi:DUF2637 domain-containing protein [Saccharopolyspora hattusasensis]|uniref:DUF2637 domain-containing protein n=1 Tax=Saccharopolyspora hattusasensis TaxID=1128679 RepID=UPI003D955C6A